MQAQGQDSRKNITEEGGSQSLRISFLEDVYGFK